MSDSTEQHHQNIENNEEINKEINQNKDLIKKEQENYSEENNTENQYHQDSEDKSTINSEIKKDSEINAVDTEENVENVENTDKTDSKDLDNNNKIENNQNQVENIDQENKEGENKDDNVNNEHIKDNKDTFEATEQKNINEDDKEDINAESKANHDDEVLIVEDNNTNTNQDDVNLSIKDETEELNKKKQEEEDRIKLENSLDDCLKKVSQHKKDGNNAFKNQSYQECEIYYNEGITEAQGFLTYYKGDIENPIYKKIKEELVCCYSNLSNSYVKQNNYTKVFSIDMFIINSLDPNWDKSYNRLINAGLNSNELDLANTYAATFKSRFSENTLAKYQTTFDALEEQNKIRKEELKKRDAERRAAAANTTTNTTGTMSDIASERKSRVSRTKKKSSFNLAMRYFFGGFMLLGGFFSMYFLYKSRYNFQKKTIKA